MQKFKMVRSLDPGFLYIFEKKNNFMIIWLASYPKSGNTLFRSILSAYFFSKDGRF